MSDEFDEGPVHLGPLADERHRPVTARRQKVGTQIRVDASRVAVSIRLVLEPLLWIAFVMGLMWLLIAVEPALRDPLAHDLVTHQNAGLFALLVGGFLVLATISALLWLPGSTTAARSRTAMSGLGMVGSGWLFANLHPVQAEDFQLLAWFSFAVGALLVVICAVPWPTRPAVEPGPVTALRRVTVAGLCVMALVMAYFAWSAAGPALVSVGAEAEAAWREVVPLLALIGLPLAAIRFVVRRPARRDGNQRQ